MVSPNPVLKGITDYLVDEASMEDELLGTTAGGLYAYILPEGPLTLM